MCNAGEKQEDGMEKSGDDWSAGIRSFTSSFRYTYKFHKQKQKMGETRERGTSLISALIRERMRKGKTILPQPLPFSINSFENGKMRML